MEIVLKNIKSAKKNLEILEDDKFIREINNFSIAAIKTLKKKKKLIFCGNGGSASDSNHIAAELVGRFMKNRVALNAISLTANTSAITAIANDLDYKKVFSRQIEAHGNKGDLLICITTSGRSKNILEAVKTAKKKNIKTLFLSSILARKIKLKTDFKILVPGTRTDRIQEMHILVGHIICELIEKKFHKS